MITFKITETIEEILNEMKTSSHWTFIEQSENVFELKDNDFDSWAKVSYFPLTKSIFIDTAWSNYSYQISEYNSICHVYYEGAYNGLLEQWLLPTLTPVNIMEAEVKSSLLEDKCTMAEFISVREKFMQFKKTVNNHIGHTHPKCVFNCIK